MPKILVPKIIESALRFYLEKTTPVFDLEMGKRLRVAREKADLTQKQLADLLGLTQTDISRLETGRTSQVNVTCEKFRIALGEHFEYMLIRQGYYRYEDITWRKDKQSRAWIGEDK